MTTFATIRTALADGLDTISGLRAVKYVTGQVNTYQATVNRGEVTYDMAMEGGGHQYEFKVAVWAPRTNEEASQAFLDGLCEPSSVKAVLESDSVGTAAGVDYLRVTAASEVKTASVGQVEYLVVEFTVEVAV